MRVTVVSGLISLMALSACGAGFGSNTGGNSDHVGVCQQQSEWARLGTVDGSRIAISCPKHGIGDYR